MRSGLRVVTLLAGVASFGCATLPDVPPALPDARLVTGSGGCSHVARGDDAVWWINAQWDLMKTDPRSLESIIQPHGPGGSSFSDIAPGFKAVWLARRGLYSYVEKFDVNASRWTAKLSTGSRWSGKAERAFLAVDDHSVWATRTQGGQLLRIDPESGAIVATISTGFMYHRALATGEGAVWVWGIGAGLGGRVARIDPETNGVTAMIPVDGLIGIGEAIAVGGGSVWVAGNNAVARINPEENRVVAAIPLRREGKQPFVNDMAFAGERLWAVVLDDAGSFTDMYYAQISLAEIDVKTNSVRSMRQLGSMHTLSWITNRSLAVLDDAAWVCLPTGLHVIPITPPN